MNRSKLFQLLPSIIALIIFSLALRLIHNELITFHFHDIVREFHNIGSNKIFLSFLFALGSYLVLTFYDVLSIQHAKARLKYLQTAFASFVGYTLSHNLGFSLVTGTAARYRLFSGWGLNPSQIAEALAFSAIVFWLGFLGLASIVFIIAPVPLPEKFLHFHLDLHWIGLISLALVAAFIIISRSRREPISLFGIEITFPTLKLTTLGMLVAAIDWTLGASVAYVLLPSSGLTFIEFLSLFQLAQFIGLISHIPGGLGVFEAVVLAFYSPYASPEKIAGALIAYRLIYYLIPLSFSLFLFFVYEVRQRYSIVAKIIMPLTRGATSLAPLFLSIAVFGAGVVLLLSGALPPVSARHNILENFVPLPIIEVSHFVGSLVGFSLLILAQGLRARLDAAFFATAFLLGVGVVVSILKGLDFEEAIILSATFMYLITSRKHFYRKSSLTSQVFETNWLMAIVLVLVGTLVLMFFAFKHTPYSHQLWWQFSFDAHAPRALRATVGSAVACLILGLMKLMRGAPKKPALATEDELKQALPLITSSPFTHAHLALVGDKSLMFEANRKAFLMYAVEGSDWIGMGDPIGDEEQFSELIWDFKLRADEYGDHAVFYQIRPKYLPLYIDAGFALLKLGNEALVELSDFTIEGKSRSSLRHARNRILKDNWEFYVAPQTEVPSLLPALREISNQWLAGKKTQEKGFSLGFFKEDYLKYCKIAVVRKNSQIVAFANIWAGANLEECSIDLMRFSDHAPQGVMDFLFVELMLWGQSQNYKYFNLGMAPLSGLESHAAAPLWNRLGSVLFRYGEHFYNFQGILNYKEKFKPIWEPRYLASPGGLHLPRVFVNLTTVISGGLRGVISK